MPEWEDLALEGQSWGLEERAFSPGSLWIHWVLWGPQKLDLVGRMEWTKCRLKLIQWLWSTSSVPVTVLSAFLCTGISDIDQLVPFGQDAQCFKTRSPRSKEAPQPWEDLDDCSSSSSQRVVAPSIRGNHSTDCTTLCLLLSVLECWLCLRVRKRTVRDPAAPDLPPTPQPIQAASSPLCC